MPASYAKHAVIQYPDLIKHPCAEPLNRLKTAVDERYIE